MTKSLQRTPKLTIGSIDYDHIRFQHKTELGPQSSRAEIYRFYVKNAKDLYIDPHAEFSERTYRTKYPDVDQALQENRFISGYDHWLRIGKEEGRDCSISPFDSLLLRLGKELDLKFLTSTYRLELSSVTSIQGIFSFYIKNAARLQLNPNTSFDEGRYQRKYPDVRRSVLDGHFVSGFQHWLQYGQFEGRNSLEWKEDARLGQLWSEIDFGFLRLNYAEHFSAEMSEEQVFQVYFERAAELKLNPNALFDESHYQNLYSDVCDHIRLKAFVSGFHHWLQFGRDEKRLTRLPRVESTLERVIGQQYVVDAIERSRLLQYFDASQYAELVQRKYGVDIQPSKVLDFFLKEGVFQGDVPTDQFDEDFYTTYYEDVAESKNDGVIPSGYVHFLAVGEVEGRLPKHDVARCLKNKMGSLSEAIFLEQVSSLERKLAAPEIILTNTPRRLNAFVPSLDPDIMFGGYISLLNFLARVVESGTEVTFYVCEDGQSNKAWFLRGIEKNSRWRAAFARSSFYNLSRTESVRIGRHDVCLAYSAWTAHVASNVAKQLSTKRFIFFVQEYESIFHENDSLQFLVESSYSLDHVALFNTSILKDFFASRKLGVFGKGGSGKYLSYQHALADNKPNQDILRSKTQKTFLFYARPERHAGRNLFEIGVIALKRAVQRGVLNPSWKIFGIGSLGLDTDVDLGNDCTLAVRSRLPLDEYKYLISSVDVGLSLMWAPHPSILPFELAKAGAVCVTNEYSNRSKALLSQYGTNIVAAEATIQGIVDGIAEAVERSNDIERRIAGAQFDWPVNWDEVFTPHFISEALALPADDQT